MRCCNREAGFSGWPWLRKFHLILQLRSMGVSSSVPERSAAGVNAFRNASAKNLITFPIRSNDPGLELAHIVFAIMRNTGLRSSELRRARHRDLDLNSNPPTFHVTGDASGYDIVPRVIPLNEHAEDAFRRAQERVLRLTK
jgi:integrase